MESTTVEVNGGNAEVARDEPNLENVETPTNETTSNENPDANNTNSLSSVKMEEPQPTEVNGDVKTIKKKMTPGAKRKLRKIKANSTGNSDIDAKPHTRGQKRKISEPDDLSSEDSAEFNGFDTKVTDNLEPGSHVLQKLIAEAESADQTQTPQTKRLRRSTAKALANMKNSDKDEDMDLDESKDDISSRIKREKESDSDSIGISNSIDSETDPLKVEDSSMKSGNSSANSSPSGVGPKLKVGKVVRNMSPAGGIKPKVVEMSNPVFREPFKYGWKRELVFRAGSDQHSIRRMADIYYYTPKGKKVRSFREVAEFLHTKELTIDNFTFFKEPLGVNNPDFEIIRDARVRDSTGPAPTPPKKTLPAKKSIAKRIVEKPLTPPLPAKPAAKSPRVTPSAIKVKLPGKKGQVKKEVKSPVKPAPEPPMLPPQWSSPAATRRSQPIIEKTPPAKPKRGPKKKLAPLENDQRHFMVSVCAGYNALSRIFQYLKVQELLRAARVCRMWRDLAAHPNLWKTVRMKNSQVTDWDGLADSLKRHGTQHLDLRKMLVAGESDGIWKKFVTVIPRVTSLVKLELCRCPVMVVEEVIKSCPQLQVLSAMSIKCDTLSLESVGNLKSCQELRLKAISGMSLQGDLSPLRELTQLSHLSLTSVKDLGKKSIEILGSLINLETLELGECSDLPEKFGTSVLLKLEKLERLRLEKGQETCCTFDILDGVSKLPTLSQLELVNFDVKNGFDKCLSNCKNIKRLLIIPTYISQSATSNNMVLGGVTELSNNLTHFVWGVTLELLRVTELFVDQCNQMSKQVTGDSIPVLKPVPCLKLIEDVEEDDSSKGDEKPQPSVTNPQVDILPLPQLQKLLLTALPKTRVKILKIPFHATWRQSISDTTTQ